MDTKTLMSRVEAVMLDLDGETNVDERYIVLRVLHDGGAIYLDYCVIYS